MPNDSTRSRIVSLLLLATTFVGLAAWSWQKWTDPQIDFGNELYIAWQISEGFSLYHDMAHRHGPLSHYVNAGLFSLFGVSIRTLVMANLVILAAICAMVVRTLRPALGRVAATTACLFFLIVLAFSQYVPIGDFNYVTPYQHAQTHSLALSLAMILLLASGAARQANARAWLYFLAGLCLGAIALGKAELLIPAAATAIAGLLVPLFDERPDSRIEGASIGAFAGGTVLGPVCMLLGLLLDMPLLEAIKGTLGNWSYLGAGVADDAFYLSGAGLDAPLENAAKLLLSSAILMFATLGAVALDRFVAARSRRVVWSTVAGLATFGALAYAVPMNVWHETPRALPATTLLLGIVLWLPPLRHWLAPSVRSNWISIGLLAILALGMLGKMLLNARLIHYGFVLAMPAAVLLVAALTGLIPLSLAQRWKGGQTARAIAIGAVAAAAFAYWSESDRIYQSKDVPIGREGDQILIHLRADRRGLVWKRTLSALEDRVGADETLLVLPEGITLNYWLRRRNPTPYNLFLPPEIVGLGGEEHFVEQFELEPPDWIVLAHRDHREFGVGPFGSDPRNGKRIMEWVDAHYRRVVRIGAEPFSASGFGTVILERARDDR